MFSHLLKYQALAALALVALVLPAPAAPVIKSDGPALKIDKYLLDDAHGVLVVDIKQILASPAYKKHFDKQLADLVALPQAQEYLKDIGFDPLKDVERMVVCVSKSCFRTGAPGESTEDGPFVLFQGKFDAAKVKAKMAELAKNHPDQIGTSDAPGGQILYRLGPRHGPYGTQLDGSTIVFAGRKAHVLAALEKASGKKTTKFLHKDVPTYLKKLKSDVAIQGFALGQMVMSSSVTAKNDGMGNQVVESTQITLADKGLKDAVLSVNIKDDARGSVVWTVKDKAKVKELTAMFTAGLETVRKESQRAADRQPKLQPLARFFNDVTIKSTGQTVTMDGKADPEMVQALILALGIIG
jgi:hypothetical protein